MLDSNLPYVLNEIIVSPKQLLLDPNNPRLKKDFTLRVEYDSTFITDYSLQERLLSALLVKEHGVNRLIDSMKQNGYVNIDSIFVKRIDGTEKYLVLEGNRRTAAIKTILNNRSELTPSSYESLNKIPVKELICDDLEDETRMTDFILSIRHIYGVKEWEPMQKAHSVYVSYMRRLTEVYSNKSFEFIRPVEKFVCDAMNLKISEVTKMIKIYRLFKQLQDEGFGVKSSHYSLLEMVVTRPAMAIDIFGWDNGLFQFSYEGLELFNELVIEEDAQITNPKKFTRLYRIWKQGNRGYIEQVAKNNSTIDDIRGMRE